MFPVLFKQLGNVIKVVFDETLSSLMIFFPDKESASSALKKVGNKNYVNSILKRNLEEIFGLLSLDLKVFPDLTKLSFELIEDKEKKEMKEKKTFDRREKPKPNFHHKTEKLETKSRDSQRRRPPTNEKPQIQQLIPDSPSKFNKGQTTTNEKKFNLTKPKKETSELPKSPYKKEVKTESKKKEEKRQTSFSIESLLEK